MAFISGVSTALLGPLGFVIFIGTVIFAVARYRRHHLGLLTGGGGAKLGIATALLSFPSFVLFFAMVVAANPKFHEELLRSMQERAAQNPQLPQFQQMLQWLATREGFLFMAGAAALMILVFLIILGSVTGALTATMRRYQNR